MGRFQSPQPCAIFSSAWVLIRRYRRGPRGSLLSIMPAGAFRDDTHVLTSCNSAFHEASTRSVQAYGFEVTPACGSQGTALSSFQGFLPTIERLNVSTSAIMSGLLGLQFTRALLGEPMSQMSSSFISL